MGGKEQSDERQQLRILQEFVYSFGRSDRILAHHKITTSKWLRGGAGVDDLYHVAIVLLFSPPIQEKDPLPHGICRRHPANEQPALSKRRSGNWERQVGLPVIA